MARDDALYNKLCSVVRLIREIEHLEKEREKMRRDADELFKEMKSLKLPNGVYPINHKESLVHLANFETHICATW